MLFKTKDINFTNVNGDALIIDNINKTLADILFNNAQSVEVHEASISLNKEGEAEIKESAKAEIERIFENAPLYMFVKKPLLEYLKKLQNDGVILP